MADVMEAGTPVPQDWAGRRVTLMGLGHHGGALGAARYLAQHGAHLTVTDVAPRASLAASLAALDGLPISAFKFGEHDPSDFRKVDYVVANPAVRPDHACLQEARRHGAVVTSEIELFLERCPAHTIGVTGSNGKSTTVTMVADVLRAAGRRTWLGGNVGGSLLSELDRMTAEDWVVLELSSFQLAHLGTAASLPAIVAITNCTPNHLDWHGGFPNYAAAKRRLIARPETLTVFNPRDPLVAAWWFECDGPAQPSWPLASVPPLSVPGQHNRQNAACAAAVAEAAGVERAAIVAGLRGFAGLKHRLQLVAEARGRRFYDDSKSTSPDATRAAIAAIEQPTWLLAGGAAKGTAFDDLAADIVRHTRGTGLFGASRHAIAASLLQKRPDYPLAQHETMDEALTWCLRQSEPGDAIVLSPGCASFDQFRDFEERGRVFQSLAHKAA